MKKRTITLALLASLSVMASAQASEFDGGFVGARVGNNRSDISGLAATDGKNATTFGIDGGYNWDMQRFLLGVDAFADFNSKKDHGTAVLPFTNNYGSDAYGVDLKLGLPKGSWLPYARLGYAHTKGTSGASSISGGDLHGGIGIEYKYTPSWGVNAEWTGSSAKSNGSKLKNDNFTVGARYYFGATKAAPAPVPAPAPVAINEAPSPEPKAAPEPKHAPAPIAEPTPVYEPAPAPKPTPAYVPAPQPKESWRIIKEQTPVTIEGANFNFDSAKLRPTAAAKLQPIVEFTKKYSDAGITVHGHTCNIGTPAYNKKLSERRAESVKAYLVKQGVEASRIITKGFGETEHIADNKTKAGREKNRRVEIHYVVIDEKRIRVTE